MVRRDNMECKSGRIKFKFDSIRRSNNNEIFIQQERESRSEL